METLESSRVCRLCGKHSGISINIFDKNESHVRKINAVLPIMVHEMDLLPKHMCHRCSYKLEEFHKFYVDCLKTDADLKGQLSWMRKADAKERIGVPMVHIENVKIKAEPPDYDIYNLDPIVENVNYINSMSSVTFPVNGVRTSDLHDGITYATYARCRCYYDKDDRSKQSASTDYEGAVPRCETKVNNDDLDTRGAGGARTNVATNTPPYRVTRSLFTQNAPRDQLMNPLATGLDCETRRYRSTGASGTSGSIGRLAGYEGDKTSSSATVRNLRPRKASVDYVGAKRKARSPGSSVERKQRNATIEVEARSKAAGAAQTELGVVAKVKVEKVDETEGRSLRPRVKTVDYLGTKRRAHVLAAASIAAHRLRDEQFSSKRCKFVNATNATRSSAAKIDDGDTKPVIKKEPVDFEESIGDVSRCTPPRPARTRVKTVELDQCRIVTMPKNVLTVENDVSGRSSPSRVRPRSGFSLSDKLKSLTRASKNGLRRRKASARQAQAVYYSPKCLRSHDVHLRNGKVRKSDDMERSLRRLRRNFGCVATRNLTIDNGLLRIIKRTDSVEEQPSTAKLNESNIKHYCEKCNLSFASKELFRLHACYD